MGVSFAAAKRKPFARPLSVLTELRLLFFFQKSFSYQHRRIRGAILILNKNKPADRKEKVLFINASQEYQQHPDVRKLNQLADSNIDKIVKAYREFKEINGFSRIVGYDELKDNDFNLNVTLYVFPEEETENIDVLKEWEELRHLEKEILETEAKIENYLKEIYQEE